jgi:hypothetical protein
MSVSFFSTCFFPNALPPDKYFVVYALDEHWSSSVLVDVSSEELAAIFSYSFKISQYQIL